MNVSIHEESSGSLILANTFTPNFTPCSKHYADKTIYFCEEIVKHGIKLCKIDTVDKFGDIFTRGLKRVTFGCIWEKLMGW